MLEKSRGLVADCIIYDLEDSVARSEKTEARSRLRQLLHLPRPKTVHEQAVRINAIDSGMAFDDLGKIVSRIGAFGTSSQRLIRNVFQLKCENLDSIVVPKVQSAADLQSVADAIKHHAPHRCMPDHGASASVLNSKSSSRNTRPLQLIGLIESARGLLSLAEICTATPFLSGIAFAAEDFALDLSLVHTPSRLEMLHARSTIVTACRAFNVPSVIDLVSTEFKGQSGQQRLKEDCLFGQSLGFNGKQCIHPLQLEPVQAAFRPSQREIEWATRVVAGASQAENKGKGAWSLEGQMIDAPIIARAERTLEKARRCGS
jgi:citrate lyase subunit beta-like protein